MYRIKCIRRHKSNKEYILRKNIPIKKKKHIENTVYYIIHCNEIYSSAKEDKG